MDFESGSASFSASGFDGNESSKKKKKKNKKEKHEARDAVENTVNAEEMTHVNKEEKKQGQGEQTVNQVIDEKTKEIQLSEYDKMISYVATLWNTDIDGDLLADQPSFYRNPNLKDFPNDTVYFEPGSPPISKKATKPKAKPKTPPNPEPSIIKTPPKATETVSADHTQNSVDHTQTTFMGDISHISKSDFESGSASFSASGFDGNESS